jgi:hypothetical protein
VRCLNVIWIEEILIRLFDKRPLRRIRPPSLRYRRRFGLWLSQAGEPDGAAARSIASQSGTARARVPGAPYPRQIAHLN